MRSDAFDQQKEPRMKGVEGWEEKDLGMRVVLRTAMIMMMTTGGWNTCEEDDADDDASGRGYDGFINANDSRGSDGDIF